MNAKILKTLAVIGGASIVGSISYLGGFASGITISHMMRESEKSRDRTPYNRYRTSSSYGKVNPQEMLNSNMARITELARAVAIEALTEHIVEKYKDDEDVDNVHGGFEVAIDEIVVSNISWTAYMTSGFDNLRYMVQHDFALSKTTFAELSDLEGEQDDVLEDSANDESSPRRQAQLLLNVHIAKKYDLSVDSVGAESAVESIEVSRDNSWSALVTAWYDKKQYRVVHNFGFNVTTFEEVEPEDAS